MVRNRKGLLLIGGSIMAMAATLYPVFVHPLLHNKDYQAVQTMNRAGVVQADVQPVGVKIWSDPFKPSEKR